MYSFKIEKELIDKAKKEAKKLSMTTSVFIRQAILEKLTHKVMINSTDNNAQLTSKDKASIGIQSAIQAIPYIGSSIATLYFGYKQERRFKKIEIFYKNLAVEIEDIKNSIVPIKNQDKDYFIAIIEELNEKVERECIKEKIEYFKNYFKKTLIHPINKSNFDGRRYFLDVLASMTLLECRSLSFLYSRNEPIKIKDIPKEQNISQYAIVGAVERLRSYGFLETYREGMTFGGSDDRLIFEKIRTSDFGRLFCEFCLRL